MNSKTQHAIELTASETNWRLMMIRKADKAFLKFQQKVFERDHHTCHFCGFSAKSYQEVINADGNYRNNRLNNLLTACSFCYQCFFLEAVGKGEFGGGHLIYLPEMTQAELNALCHVLFAHIVSGNKSAAQSRNIYRGLKLRTQLIEKHLGEGFSNPSLYGRVLIDAKSRGANAIHHKAVKYVRLLPDITRFVLPVKTWLSESMQALTFN